ncbi:hypothetical protein ACFOD4_20040 [Pseudoroseomonas globiformis]|uniref:Uncharacterized protein n=1 Tax=Teichococcus globiformis TaxID=2307229 RepID=A0ABV7G7Z4_9PROT
MNSLEFTHGTYTIKTFQRDGICRARAFRDGAWLRDVSDWTGATLEDSLQRMRDTLDALDSGEDEGEVLLGEAPFLREAS